MTKNKNKNRIFRFNRRIRGLTNYSLRLKLLKSEMTRIVVRKTNSSMIVQFVDYEDKGDKIITSAQAIDLKKFGFTINTGNITAAYLTGFLAGKRLLNTKFKKECIVDFGLQNVKKGSRLFAVIKGVKDAGVSVRVSDNVFPSEDRLKGVHLKSKESEKIIIKTKKAIEALK